MGRTGNDGSGNVLSADFLLYGRKKFQDKSLDAARPTPAARQKAKEMIQAYRAGDLAAFSIGMRGYNYRYMGGAPLLDEIYLAVAGEEIDRIIKAHRIKRRARGATEERQDLQRLLVGPAHARLHDDERPESVTSLVQEVDLMKAALRRPGAGPIKDHYLGLISTSSHLNEIHDRDVLKLLSGEDASPEAREAFESHMRRTVSGVVNENLRNVGINAMRSERSGQVVFLRHSSPSRLLHITNGSYMTLCGKRGGYAAKHGAWADAGKNPDYRRCRSCEKAAEAHTLQSLAEERQEDLPGISPDNPVFEAKTPQQYADKVIRSEKIQKALDRIASQKADEDYNDRREAISRAIAEETGDLVFEEAESGSNAYSYRDQYIWRFIDSGLRREMRDAGIDIGMFESESSEPNLRSILGREDRRKVFDRVSEARRIRSSAGWSETYKLDQRTRDFVQRKVKRFIREKKAADKARASA